MGYHRQWRRGFELRSNPGALDAIKTLATLKKTGWFLFADNQACENSDCIYIYIIYIIYIYILYIYIIYIYVIYIYHRIYVLKNTPKIGRIGRTAPIKWLVFFQITRYLGL